MKAVLCKQYGLPDTLVIEDVPALVPAAGQVVVSMKAARVNFPDRSCIAKHPLATSHFSPSCRAPAVRGSP